MIDLTFFFGSVEIAERDDTGYDDGLKYCITKYEPQFLIKALGYPFYKLFIANIEDARFQELINGKDYVVDGIDYRWQGLIQVIEDEELETEIKISPIAMYIYLMWKRENATKSLQTGETKQLTGNSTALNGIDKMVNAENEMVEIVRSMHHYLNNDTTTGSLTYPEWDRTRIDPYLLVKNNTFGL